MALFELPNKAEREKKMEKYTQSVTVPQYKPSEHCPMIEELVARSKTVKLLAEIANSSVSDKEKEFLRNAAQRHLVFNYSKVADYYAHASAEMQNLMEKSALVIVDYDNALANGFVELTKSIEELRKYDEEHNKK